MDDIKVLNIFEKVYGLKPKPHPISTALELMMGNSFFMMPNNPEFHKLKPEEAKKLK